MNRSKPVLLVLLLLISSANLGCASRPERIERQAVFETRTIQTGVTQKHQTILTGRFLGGDTSEIAITHVDATGTVNLQIFALDGKRAWAAPLDRATAFVDLASIGGTDRIVAYAGGRLSWLDLESGTMFPLIEIDDRLTRDTIRGAPRVRVVRDLNDDGLDDVVMPDFDGFWIALQQNDGSFDAPVHIGPPEPFLSAVPMNDRERTYREVGITPMTIPWYLQRVHQLDLEGDGLQDLAFWNDDRFDVYRQQSDGRFTGQPVSLVPDVAFDFDGPYTSLFGHDDGALKLVFGLKERSERTTLFAIEDVTGNGIPDMVLQHTTGRSILKQRTTYRFHYGRRDARSVVFSSAPDSVVHATGRATGIQADGYAQQVFEDMNGDGQKDLLLIDIMVSASGVARTIAGRSVPIDLEVFHAVDGQYVEEATVKRKFRRFAPFTSIFFPPILVGDIDIDGDGRKELIVGANPNELHIYAGAESPLLFAADPTIIETKVPVGDGHTMLAALSGRERFDLLMRTEPGVLTALLTRDLP